MTNDGLGEDRCECGGTFAERCDRCGRDIASRYLDPPPAGDVDLTGHERYETVTTRRDDLGWRGYAWQSKCECGWVSATHFHPLDAGMEATEHAAAAGREL